MRSGGRCGQAPAYWPPAFFGEYHCTACLKIKAHSLRMQQNKGPERPGRARLRRGAHRALGRGLGALPLDRRGAVGGRPRHDADAHPHRPGGRRLQLLGRHHERVVAHAAGAARRGAVGGRPAAADRRHLAGGEGAELVDGNLRPVEGGLPGRAGAGCGPPGGARAGPNQSQEGGGVQGRDGAGPACELGTRGSD